MKYLLDTNILSELTKPSPSELLVEWLDEHEGDSAMSAVTIGELVRAVEALPQGSAYSIK